MRSNLCGEMQNMQICILCTLGIYCLTAASAINSDDSNTTVTSILLPSVEYADDSVGPVEDDVGVTELTETAEETEDADVLRCGEPPSVLHARTIKPDKDYEIGVEVTYTCQYGYFPDGTLPSATCVFLEEQETAAWTEPKIVCIPRSCGDPGFVSHGQRIGLLFTFPNKVSFRCDPGYELIGPSTRFCLTSGRWSGRLPSCKKTLCKPPQNPEHGRAVYSSLEYDSILHYKCDEGYIPKNKEPRICSSGGIWSGNETTCKEAVCNLPKPPEHGSMEILGGEPRVGSIALYSCDEGRMLSGSPKAKCWETGEWTFDAPKCLEPCNVPNVDHGRIGRYEKSSRYKSSMIFKKIAVGTKLVDGEKLFLHCDSGYEPLGTSDWQRKVICRAGLWAVAPFCEPADCRVTPPGTENATVISMNRTHGGSVVYECKEDFELDVPATVVCVLGMWKGAPPVCKDTRCFLEHLKFPGLFKDSTLFYKSGESFEPWCTKGYYLARKENNSLSCVDGQWVGHMPPCVAATCSNPPVPLNGHIPALKTSYLHSSTPVYECFESFFEKRASTVQCLFGEWVGQLPICADSRCHSEKLRDLKGVNVLQKTFIYSQERLILPCLEGYTASGFSPLCLNGEWHVPDSSLCTENSCIVRRVQHGAITEKKFVRRFTNIWRKTEEYAEVALGKAILPDSQMFLTCERGYTFRGTSTNNVLVTCREGKWFPNPLCLRQGAKFQEDLPVATGTITSKAHKVPEESSSSPTEPNHVTSTHLEGGSDWNQENCFCEYPLNDTEVVAHAEDQLLHFKSLVKKDSTVVFRCRDFGFSRLIGPKSIVCDSCRQWHPSELPSCVPPIDGDANVFFYHNVKVMPDGTLEIQKNSTGILSCFSYGIANFPNWTTVPSRKDVRIINEEISFGRTPHYSSGMKINNAQKSVEGTYSCAVGTFRPNTFYLRVVDSSTLCPELTVDNMIIHYSRGQEVNSTATLQCKGKEQKMVGPDILTCTSSGQWSHKLPECTVSSCSIDSLYQLLPEGAVPVLVEGTGETVPYESSFKIACEDNLALVGQTEARCMENATWEIGKFQCVPGCSVLMSDVDSKLIIEPAKQHYRMGEQVFISCPTGFALTSDVELLMCLNNGWSEKEIPVCRPLE